MKIRNKYHKTIGFFLMAFALTIIATFSYATTNMDVTVEEIYFNYEDGNTNDALTISNDGTSIVNDAEWDSYYGETHKFAYIKGQSNRKIKVRFNAGSYSGVMHLLIKVSYGYYDDGIGTICNLFIPNFDIGANDTQILTLNGTLPNSVGVRQFDWEWEIYAIPVNNSNYCAAWSSTFTSHHFYTLLAAPQAPMAQPWERVLDYACSWASGQNTDSNVTHNLITNLYESSGLTYNGSQSHYRRDPSNSKYVFYLSSFLDEWSDADCQDVSMFLSVLSGSLGGSLTQTKRIQGPFYTKFIDPIGWSGWSQEDWVFHQVAWNNNVYDACLSLEYSSPYIPINVNIDNPYKIDLVDDCSNCYYLWNPQSAFVLGNNDPYRHLPTEIQ